MHGVYITEVGEGAVQRNSRECNCPGPTRLTGKVAVDLGIQRMVDVYTGSGRAWRYLARAWSGVARPGCPTLGRSTAEAAELYVKPHSLHRPAPAPPAPSSLLARLPTEALLWNGRRRSPMPPMAGSLLL